MKSVIGQVDRFEGMYVTGWAIELPYIRPCKIRVVTDSGELVGQGKANIPREDLSDLRHGRNNFAFRVPVVKLEEAVSLRVYANDTELTGSPIVFKAGVFDGFLRIADGTIDGWVVERGGAASEPEVTLTDPRGRHLGSLHSVLKDRVNPLFAPAQFAGELPDACFGREELEIYARVGDATFARARAKAKLRGYLDVLTPDRCAGWLCSPDVPSRRFTIAVFRDGEEIGRDVCRVMREDLSGHVPGAVDIGFDIAFDKSHRSNVELCTVSLRLADTDLELFGGPFIAGRRPAVLGKLQAAAQSALDSALPPQERAVLRSALAQFARSTRAGPDYLHLPLARTGTSAQCRVAVVIPVYRGVSVTRACIESVLRSRNAETDPVVVLNDASPDADMADMLAVFQTEPNFYLFTNETNLGFVRTVNRGLAFLTEGDVLLLNSDTVMFRNCLDEMSRVAHSAPDIGTVTALSNNATIFSYPHPALTTDALDDASWEELAAEALARNAGQSINVPTGHGFCMLIKREVLDRLPSLDEMFGRGYGEENEFCLRALDLGYRHVAATGALVQHRESVSFGSERSSLLRVNLRLLQERFPEFTAAVMEFERTDPLREGRWALDRFRLRRAVERGMRFALVVGNWLGGGTQKAVSDISELVGYRGAVPLHLSNRADGLLELSDATLPLRAVFLPQELDPLFELLAAASVELVVVHQLLGYDANLIRRMTRYVAARPSVAWIHDFYPVCPRVTLLDAIGRYCGVADATVCRRCVEIGGGHEAARLEELSPAEHRKLLGDFYTSCGRVAVPSADTARHLRRANPTMKLSVLPHLHPYGKLPTAPRDASEDSVMLLGAIGPHKGSAKLLEIARLARLTHPRLHFHVIGYTDIDAALKKVGNVTISGKYAAEELPALLAAANAKYALFLHVWPETFSYTLSEAVMHGLIPLVPDIGAPAERVRASGIGFLFPFPVDASQVLGVLDTPEVRSARFAVSAESLASFSGTTTVEDVAALWHCEPVSKDVAIPGHDRVAAPEWEVGSDSSVRT